MACVPNLSSVDINSIFLENLNRGVGTLVDDCGTIWTKIDLSGLLGLYINVKDYGAIGNGIADDTAAINAAISAAGVAATGRNIVFFPKGTYRTTSTIVINIHGVTLLGCGQVCTIILFDPPSNTGTAFRFITNPSGGILTYCNMTGFRITGAADLTNQVAIELVDVELCNFDNIVIREWTDITTNGSIGILIKGRQTCVIEKMTILADQPIVCGVNPNANLDLDHFTFRDLYLICTYGGQCCFRILDTVFVTNLNIEGYQAWVGGANGMQWENATGIESPLSVNINNVRWEQGFGGYCLRITAGGGASMHGLSVKNCQSGAANNGFFFRNIASGIFTGNVYTGTLASINIDATVINFYMLGNTLFGTGAIFTGWVLGAFFGQDGSVPVLRNQINGGQLGIGTFATPKIITGVGSPEGAVVAPVGCIFLRQNGGAATSFYVKESGVGNTGWIAK